MTRCFHGGGKARAVSRGVLPLTHALVLLLAHASVGLEMPVLSLMLVARGATLESLPVVMGLTLVATVLCEVPSGVAADAFGRRALFGCAMALQVAAHLVLLVLTGTASVALSCALRGVGLAMRTGTLDAIEIDRVVARHPDARERLGALDALNGRLALLESAGTGAGALAGGLLASLDASYTVLILTVICASAGALVGALACFPNDSRRTGSARQGLADTVRGMRATVAEPGPVRLVLVSSAAAGVIMLAVETYWQLAYGQLAGAGQEWALGPLNCAGMAAAALGSAAAMRYGQAASEAIGRAGRRGLYAAAHVCALLCALSLAMAGTVWAFAAAYVLYYVFIAARSVIEQTVLHEAVPSGERAGMASVQSLALRGGGALASVACAAAALGGIACVWIACSAISLVLESVALLASRGASRRIRG